MPEYRHRLPLMPRVTLSLAPTLFPNIPSRNSNNQSIKLPHTPPTVRILNYPLQHTKLMTELLNTHYLVSEEIGRGKSGVVYKCHSALTGHLAAVKSIDKRIIQNDTIDSQCLRNEAKLMQLVSGHVNILQIFDVYEDDDFLHIVMEYCGSNDLYDRITARPVLSESDARCIMVQLMDAIAHCHRLGVAHRDIKPDNILFNNYNVLKLADFGSSECFQKGGVMFGIVGTPYYVAPEVVAGKFYNEKVDVWSAGVILYIMLAGFPPFNGESAKEIFEAVLRGNLRFPRSVFGSLSTEVKDLLRRMLAKDVSRRFSADQVLKHPWMTNGGELKQEVAYGDEEY